MKLRGFLLLICFLFVFSGHVPFIKSAPHVEGASKKITALPADTSPTSDDLVLTVNNPAGASANKKVALKDLLSVPIESLNLDQNVETLSNNKTLVITDYPIQKLDPDGSDRDVVMPAEASSTDLIFWIYNAANGAGEDLTVKDDAAATIVTLVIL